MKLQHHKNAEQLRYSRATIWLVAIAFLAFCIWSANAPLDQIVRGRGKVVPSSNTQIIQSLEGGILSQMLVREGDIITRDQPLVILDDTKFRGALQELETKMIAQEAKLLRLEQELNFAGTLELPKRIADVAPLVAQSETQLFESGRSEFRNSQERLAEALALRDEEVAMLTALSDQQLVPALDLLHAKQERSEIKRQLDALLRDYELSRAKSYSETLSAFMELQASLDTRQDQLARTTLVSTVDGTVNEVSITTVGGVIRPGDPILELTPFNEELWINVRIRPEDVAFIYPGMPSNIKFSAYDYTIYGTFPGQVLNISADTFEDEDTRDTQPYYKVLVEVDPSAIEDADDEIIIRSGMLVDVELQVGQKTVLQYILTPLFKTTEAFREP